MSFKRRISARLDNLRTLVQSFFHNNHRIHTVVAWRWTRLGGHMAAIDGIAVGECNGVPRIQTRFGTQTELYMRQAPQLIGGRRENYIFEQHMVPPGDLPAHSFDDHMFLLPISATATPFRSKLNGKQVTGLLEPMRFRFLAAGDSLQTAWDAPIASVLVAISPGFLARITHSEYTGVGANLVSRIEAHTNPTLLHLTMALRSFHESGMLAGTLFEQCLVSAIGMQILASYGDRAAARLPVTAKVKPLLRWKLARVEQYIQDNLGGDINLSGIAACVHLSPHQLTRAFRAATGKTLWQHVLECRVQTATLMLRRDTGRPLGEVAQACGFESYSQFVAAFVKFTGQLPSHYRRRLPTMPGS